MTSISINNLSLHFGTTAILENVSFSLEENDKLGIIGVNGSGKTSLFKLICGEYEADCGEVYISKGKSIGILTQYGAFDSEDGEENDSALEHMYRAFPELIAAEERLHELESLLEDYENPLHDNYTKEYTSLQDRYISNGGLEFRSRAASILSKLGFDNELMNAPVKILSGGQKTRLALAIRLSTEPDILMLDEPTNHLDIETLSWLEGFLSQYKKCVMVISHDRYFLDKVTNKTLVVENHKAKLYSGSYTACAKQREIDREIYERHYRNQQKEIERQKAYIEQQRAWNRERNIIAAESRQKLLDKMEKLDAPQSAPKAVRMSFTSSLSSGNDVMNVKNLSERFGERVLFNNLNFLVKKNDRLLIVGKNGCGKSTLIKLMMQNLVPTSGKIELGYNVLVGYYDQENQNLDESKTVIDELWDAYPQLPEVKIRSTLALFRFVGDDVYKMVDVLSGGERARLTLAKLILSKMNLLILDEPTNHLDINSREALEQALSKFDGTIIAVSHDRYFIEKLATRIIELKPEGYTDNDMFDYSVSHPGNGYSEFRAFTEARLNTMAQKATDASTSDEASDTQTNSKEQYLKNKQEIADARKKANRQKKLNEEMKLLENRLSELEKKLQSEEACADYKLLMELDEEKNNCEERLLEIYEELENV